MASGWLWSIWNHWTFLLPHYNTVLMMCEHQSIHHWSLLLNMKCEGLSLTHFLLYAGSRTSTLTVHKHRENKWNMASVRDLREDRRVRTSQVLAQLQGGNQFTCIMKNLKSDIKLTGNQWRARRGGITSLLLYALFTVRRCSSAWEKKETFSGNTSYGLWWS